MKKLLFIFLLLPLFAFAGDLTLSFSVNDCNIENPPEHGFCVEAIIRTVAESITGINEKYLLVVSKNVILKIYEDGRVDKLEWKNLEIKKEDSGVFYYRDNMPFITPKLVY